MSMPLSVFFQQMEFDYAAADFASIAKNFLLPGGVYVGNDVIVLKDRPGLEAMLRDQCRRNFGAGIRRVRPVVVRQSGNRQFNYSVWIRWDHFDETDTHQSSVNARYVCRDDARGMPRIQLVELLDLPPCYSYQEVRGMSEYQRRLV